MKRMFSVLTAAFLAVVLLAGCATPGNTTTNPTGATSSTPTSTTQLSSGTVEVRVMDAPRTDNVSSILVTVSRIEVQKAGSDNDTPRSSDNETVIEESDNSTQTPEAGWITIPLSGNVTFDLMVLKNTGLQQLLGSANLTAGKYTQIRMRIDKVEVKIGDDPLQTAKLPSSKLRFIHPFNINANQTTVLVFDFDADQFVTVAGSQIIVKPVIKLTSTEKQ